MTTFQSQKTKIPRIRIPTEYFPQGNFMTRRVFFCFHYQRDSWRASKIRRIGAIEGNPVASDNAWEEITRSGDATIKNWIANQFIGRTCTIVLVGAETAFRPWVRYEIQQSWNNKMGILGIRIHNILDHNQTTSAAGPDPFDSIILNDGRKLSSIARLYNPPSSNSRAAYNIISVNMSRWIEVAIATRQNNERLRIETP